MLSSLLVLVLFTVSVSAGRRWENAMGWCYHSGSELHVGDFNGDTKMDMLCHDSSGNKWIAFAGTDGRFSGNSWHRGMGWCYHAGAELHIGDFNGDGRSDMLCHDGRGYKWISYANTDGNFNAGTGWERGMGWCYHSGAQLLIGDFNGDGRDDMLCHDTNSGYKWIALANENGAFTGTSWERAMGWCNHASAELHLGDFNGDGRTDMLCHDTTNGYKWIAFASWDGSFTGTNWEHAMGWCYHNGASLHVEDFNGDSRDDIVCHDGSGYKWIANANIQGKFTGTSWQQAMGWCYHAGAQFFVADFDGDNHADMLCHDTGNGYKWFAYASLTGTF